MRLVVYPYRMFSESSKVLAQALGAIRVHKDRKYVPRNGDLIVNWGSSSRPNWFAMAEGNGAKILNRPDNVGLASNKLRALETMSLAGVAIPSYTQDPNVALGWNRVYARTTLNGHSGMGITVLDNPRELPDARLYTKGIEIDGEYRVHVFNGEVISYTKKRRHDDDRPDHAQSLVRSHGNGWIFTRQNLKRLERIEKLAVDAVKALGLDFGAVDIVKDEDGKVYVLEVNTACGIEGQTLTDYVEAIKKYAAIC